jgi:hypothetical protein
LKIITNRHLSIYYRVEHFLHVIKEQKGDLGDQFGGNVQRNYSKNEPPTKGGGGDAICRMKTETQYDKLYTTETPQTSSFVILLCNCNIHKANATLLLQQQQQSSSNKIGGAIIAQESGHHEFCVTPPTPHPPPQ